MQAEKTLNIAGFDVKVIKKSNVKNLYLKVCSPSAEVRVTVPYFTSDAQIERFVQSRVGFIERNTRRIRLQAKRDQHNYATGEIFYLWGNPLTLQVVENEKNRTDVQQVHDKLVLHIPKNSQIPHDVSNKDEFLNLSANVHNLGKMSLNPASNLTLYENKINEWYRSLLKKAIAIKAPAIEAKIGVHASEYRIKNMKTRWGTCNTTTARIWVNLQLAKKPHECLDYLLVHELCHLLEKNHTKRFWALVEQFYPQWRKVKKTLDETIV